MNLQDIEEDDFFLAEYDFLDEEHSRKLFYRTGSNHFPARTFIDASDRWDFKVSTIEFFQNMPSFDINQKDGVLNTVLFKAVIRSDKETVKALINLGIDVNAVNIFGSTALMYYCACNSWDFHMTKILIDAGANVNIANQCGNTALMFAIFRNNSENVKLLLEAGADVRALNRQYFGTRALLKRRSIIFFFEGTDETKKLVEDAHQRVRDIKNISIIESFMNDDIANTLKKY